MHGKPISLSGLKLIAIIATICLTLSACGVRGPLERPPGGNDQPGEKGEPAPHTPSILDRLL